MALVLGLALCFPATVGAQTYPHGLVDKVIALVGGEMIQLSALEQEVQMQMMQGLVTDKNLRCNILENLLVSKLMITQARLDSLPVNDEQVELQLEEQLLNIKTRLGGEKETEAYFNKPMFKIRQEWKESFTEQTLAQSMQSEIMKDLPELTPAEVNAFYKKVSKDSLPIIPTQYQLRQIVVYPSKDDAVLQVKERLLEFRQRVLNGEKFSTLATLYSQDPYSARRGGELGMAAKTRYWPAFGDAAIVLKEGQVSQIVETPDGFHIIQMIRKEGDMFNARHILLKPEIALSNKRASIARLDSVLNLIVKDSVSFELAARRFSEDPKSRAAGGLMTDENSGVTFFEKDQLKVNDYNVLKNMKPGDISDTFETTDNEGREGNTVFKILKLEKILPSHTANIQDDYHAIQNLARGKQANDAIEAFIKEKQKLTYIRIDPLFQDCAFQREGWIK